MMRFYGWPWFPSIKGLWRSSRFTSSAHPALNSPKNEIAIAVVGAHLSGMSLNSELLALGAHFVEKTSTTNDYRLYELADSRPPKPGLLRVSAGQGYPIEVEVWEMSVENFGRFMTLVTPPLSIGTLTLIGGRAIKGFLVEAIAVAQARDISSFGGWRAFLRNRQNGAT